MPRTHLLHGGRTAVAETEKGTFFCGRCTACHNVQEVAENERGITIFCFYVSRRSKKNTKERQNVSQTLWSPYFFNNLVMSKLSTMLLDMSSFSLLLP